MILEEQEIEFANMKTDQASSHFPALTTRRLFLRQLKAGDTDALFAIKSDPDVTRHYGQEPHQSPANTLAWIQRLQVSYDQCEDFAWGITLKDDVLIIGACTLWNFDPNFRCAEIGYELHPKYGRQGIMSEAISSVLAFGFTDLGLHRIEANPLAENIASRNLLLKLGFKQEGVLRQRHFFRGRYEDQLYFGLLRDEWKNSSNVY